MSHKISVNPGLCIKILMNFLVLTCLQSLDAQCSYLSFESENLNTLSASGWSYKAYNRVSNANLTSLPGTTGTIDSQYNYFVNFPPIPASATTHLNNWDTTRFNWQVISKRDDEIYKCLSTTYGGSKAFRLGREYFSESGAEGLEKSFYNFTGSFDLKFSYAMVVEDPSTTHSTTTLPFFGVKVNGSFVTINHAYPNTTSTTPIYSIDDGYNIMLGELKIKPWTCASITVPQAQNGIPNKVEFIVGDCSHGGHWAYALIDDICSSNGQCANTAYVSKLTGFPCNPKLQGVVINQPGTSISDIKIALYKNGTKLYTSSSVLSSYNSTTKKLDIQALENHFPPNFAPVDMFDFVIEVYGSGSNIIFTSHINGMNCEYEDAQFGCYQKAYPHPLTYTKDRCGNFNLSGYYNPTIFYPGKSIQMTATFSDIFIKTNDYLNGGGTGLVPISILNNYNSATRFFSFSPSYFENLIGAGKFHDIIFEYEEYGAYGKFRTEHREGVIRNPVITQSPPSLNIARECFRGSKGCKYQGPSDFFVKNNQFIEKKNTHRFVTGKCKMDVDFEYGEWTNFTGVKLVRDSIYDHRNCDTCGDTVLCYKVIEEKDLLDDCYCRFNFNKFIDSFRFSKHAPVIDCYNLIQFDSTYDCNKDSMTYTIKYKLNQKYNGRDIFISMKIGNVCDLTSCENYVCKSNAGTVLNPILNNLRGNFRPQEEKLYIVKREDLVNNSLRKGQTFTGFTPLYSYDQTNGWVTSTSNNWVTKDLATNFDEKGNQIETKDPLNIYTSYKFGFNKSFVTSVAKNAKYKECINLTFEDEYFNVDPYNNYSNGFKKEYYLPKVGNGQVNSNTLNTYDEVYNISYSDVVENMGHTGSNSYFVKPFFGQINSPNFSEREPYIMKVTQLCGPNDPDYFATTYEVNTNTVNSVENSYNPAFQLEKGKKYILSYWVKDAASGQNSYFSYADRGYIDIDFDCNAPEFVKTNINKSKPVEGWQRDFFEFEIPQTANLFKLIFMPNSNGTYYDDIRIFPSNGNMKSFVYDPINLRFSAELDENNFATFYDYDEQGQLIRVRKETERGIMTIKESRTSLKQE